jgi:hypothetical protein
MTESYGSDDHVHAPASVDSRNATFPATGYVDGSVIVQLDVTVLAWIVVVFAPTPGSSRMSEVRTVGLTMVGDAVHDVVPVESV